MAAAAFSQPLFGGTPAFPWWNDAESIEQPDVSTATTMPLNGGQSPNGKFIIQVIGNDPMDYGYAFGFFKSNGISLLSQVTFDSGFCVLKGASEIDRALWNSDNTLVAIEDHDTRHSMALHLVAFKNGKAQKIIMPSFGRAMGLKTANIHGGAEGACGCDPLIWKGTMLTFRFYAGPYVSNVKVKVALSGRPHATLVSETSPAQIEN
jgi:hypothetical protein